jgi:hypothetical protein
MLRGHVNDCGQAVREQIMKIDGRCHCGYITYEAEIDPEKVMICHCADCQTLSGSAFVRSPSPEMTISGCSPVSSRST